MNIEYRIKNKNYEILQNIKEIYNNKIIEEINKVNNDKDISNKINNIINLYNKIINLSEINIIYDINKKDEINIFGAEFVKSNKDKCKMIIDNKAYKLKEKYYIKDHIY